MTEVDKGVLRALDAADDNVREACSVQIYQKARIDVYWPIENRVWRPLEAAIREALV